MGRFLFVMLACFRVFCFFKFARTFANLFPSSCISSASSASFLNICHLASFHFVFTWYSPSRFTSPHLVSVLASDSGAFWLSTVFVGTFYSVRILAQSAHSDASESGEHVRVSIAHYTSSFLHSRPPFVILISFPVSQLYLQSFVCLFVFPRRRVTLQLVPHTFMCSFLSCLVCSLFVFAPLCGAFLSFFFWHFL